MHPFYFTYIAVFLLSLFIGVPHSVAADEDKMKAFRSSGLPLPRFVSLEEEKTHVRAGPGEQYPIEWVLTRQGLPVEVVLEFENWRKIRDMDGQEGWVFHSLLSGKRTGIVTGADKIPVYQQPYEAIGPESELSMMLEPRVIVSIKECHEAWCAIESGGFSGWVQRKFIWGVYANENFD